MAPPVRFPYTPAGTTEASLMPRLSLTLTHAQRAVETAGLLETGAAVNVLPYPVGVALGADWAQHTTVISLVGSLGRVEAHALVLSRHRGLWRTYEPGITPRLIRKSRGRKGLS